MTRPHVAYQPALDGVRALAVTAVVLYHGGVPGFGGGYLGVDTFFVLSGFLITSLLLAEHAATGRIAMGAFWLRRARRLLPALLLLLMAVVVAGRYLLDSEEFGRLRLDMMAALGYAANWRMIWRGSDYFAATADPSLVQHTWSLGIEEQFYVVWPLLVAAVAAVWAARRWHSALLTICLAGAAGSAVAAALLFDPADAGRAYFGTDTRAQALLIGAALAVVAVDRPGLLRRAWLTTSLAVVGAIVTVALWTSAGTPTALLFQGGLTAAALATAAVLAHLTTAPNAVAARLLSVAPLVWLGRISYGVYLWHWPVFELLTADRTGLAGVALLALRLAVTLGISTLSYFAVEMPIRRGLRLPRLTPVATVAGGYVAAAIAIVLVGSSAPAPTAAAPATIAIPIVTPSASGKPSPLQRPGRKPGSEPRVTFFGDSVAWTLGSYLPAHPGLWTNTRAVQGCGIATLPDILIEGAPHTNYPGCTAWAERWQRGVNADDPDVAVILLNRWELMDRRLDGRYQHVGDPAYDAYLMTQLDHAVTVAGSKGAAVVLLTATYTHRHERPDGGIYPEDRPERVDAWNRLLAAEEAARPDQVTILDLNKVVCPDGKFTWSVNGIRIRSDGLHFTPSGDQRIIAPWLLPRLAAVATGTYSD